MQNTSWFWKQFWTQQQNCLSHGVARQQHGLDSCSCKTDFQGHINFLCTSTLCLIVSKIAMNEKEGFICTTENQYMDSWQALHMSQIWSIDTKCFHFYQWRRTWVSTVWKATMMLPNSFWAEMFCLAKECCCHILLFLPPWVFQRAALHTALWSSWGWIMSVNCFFQELEAFFKDSQCKFK